MRLLKFFIVSKLFSYSFRKERKRQDYILTLKIGRNAKYMKTKIEFLLIYYYIKHIIQKHTAYDSF